jgi:hypothetical protein
MSKINWKLDKNFTESIFENISIKEKSNIKKVKGFIHKNLGISYENNIRYKETFKKYKNEIEQMKKYIKKYDFSEKVFKVKLFLPKHKYGRIIFEDHTSLSIYHRPTRHSFCYGIYVDIDIVNSMPSIIFEICKINNYDMEKIKILEYYVKNRDKFIEEIKEYYDTTYEKIKKLLLIIMMGGKYESWLKDEDIDVMNKNKHKNLINIENKLSILRDLVHSHNEDIKKIKLEKWTTCDKEKRGVFAIWYQTIERFIQETIIKYLIRKKGLQLNEIVPCQDGFMILIEHWYEDIIKDCEKEIKNTLEIEIKLKRKEFDERFEIDEVDELDDDEIIISDDNEGADHFLKKNKNIIKKCNEEFYIKNGNLWNKGREEINYFLKKKFLESNYCKIKGNKKIIYSKNMNGANNLKEAVLSKIENDNYLDQKFIDTTKYKLCFNNGVFDIRTKEFKKWEDCNEIFTMVIINYDYIENIDEQYIKEVNKHMLEPILGYQKNKFLKYYARRIAGCIEDKHWSIFVGERNCGKSKIQNLLENTFENYINTLNGGTFIYQKRIGKVDEEKNSSYLLDSRYTRISMVQEVENDKSIKLCGTTIKKFNSGGDKLKARSLYKDSIEFKIQSSLSFAFNDSPEIIPTDCLETLVLFIGIHQFKSEEYINNRIEKGATDQELKNYKLMDPSISDKIKNKNWINAFLHLIINSYEDKPVTIESNKDQIELDEFKQETGDDYEFILNSFEITENNNDLITNNNLKTFIEDNNLTISLIKLNKRLRNIGAISYKINSERGLKKIVFKNKN